MNIPIGPLRAALAQLGQLWAGDPWYSMAMHAAHSEMLAEKLAVLTVGIRIVAFYYASCKPFYSVLTAFERTNL